MSHDGRYEDRGRPEILRKPSVIRLAVLLPLEIATSAVFFWLIGRQTDIVPFVVVLVIINICGFALGWTIYLRRCAG
jgi:hypothetical protein